MHDTPSHPDPSPDASAELGAALRRAYTPTASLDPADLDAAIAAASHARLSRPRLRPRLLVAGGALAAAAGLALAFIILSTRPRPGPAAPIASGAGAMPATVAGDLNADGALDILDALALSNRLRHGEHLSPGARPDSATDINADGSTTPADLDALALRIVSLGGAG